MARFLVPASRGQRAWGLLSLRWAETPAAPGVPTQRFITHSRALVPDFSGGATLLSRLPTSLHDLLRPMFKPLMRASLTATLLALGALAQADSFKHYRHMVFRESPMENLSGRHEIDAEKAKTTLHHRFRYDDQGRLIEVRRAVGDKVTRNLGSFEGFFWWAPQVRIEYAPGKETRSFYNEAGDRIAAHGPVWRMEFTLDAQGRRSALHYFDKDGKPVEGEWGAHRYAWEHPEPGVVIETRHKINGDSAPLRSNFLFHRVRLEFGHDDLLDTMLNIDAKGDLVATNSGSAVDRIIYDPWGSFVRWQVYDTQRRPKNGKRADGGHG